MFDPAANPEFLHEMIPPMHLFANRTLRDWNCAQEAVQDTLAEVLQSGKAFPNKKEASKYCFGILKNVCIDVFRARTRESSSGSAPFDENVQVEHKPRRSDTDDRIKSLRIAFSKLSASDQSFLTLKYFNCLSSKKIAECLNMPESTFCGKLQQALTKLSALLNNE